jgi:hypothetical protein
VPRHSPTTECRYAPPCIARLAVLFGAAGICSTAKGCGRDVTQNGKADWGMLKAGFTELVTRYPTQSNMLQMTEFSADTWEEREDYYGECRKGAAES